MKNLENFGVQELNTIEIKVAEGGFLDMIIQTVIKEALGYGLKRAIKEGYDKYYSL